MTARKKPEVPEPDPWEGQGGEEQTEVGIGTGFARWQGAGEHIRGVYVNRFQAKTMNRAAIVLRLVEIPTVTIEHDGTKISVEKGALVNVGLNADLERKIPASLEGTELGIVFDTLIPTPKGQMRSFRVLKFGELPF